eukprot:m.98817 g.98817  ORF g.98817 m.98817 type:complete len:318 (-) comp10280_c0_seq1:4074-5027(-)
MSYSLPPALLKLFDPDPPLKYLPPTTAEPHERTYASKMAGVSSYLSLFEDPKDTPPATFGEKTEARRARKAKEKQERVERELAEKKAAWDPNSDPNAEGTDAFKTLFVGRLSYNVTADQLEKEFEVYGPIKRVKMVNDQEGRPRGMAFIEFEHEEDMATAFKRGDGKKIDGKRVVVDVERGRTVKTWLPRRLGGGLGATRKGAPNECIKISGRVGSASRMSGEPGRGESAGGYRGGYDRADDRDRRRPSSSRDDRDRGGSYERRGGYDDRDYRDRDRDRTRRSSRDRDRGGYDRDRRDRGYDRRSSYDDRDRDRRRY